MMPVYVLTEWNLAACVRSSFAAVSGLFLVLATDSSNAFATYVRCTNVNEAREASLQCLGGNTSTCH